LALTVLLLLTGAALAQAGGGYDLGWSSVDAGGYTFSTGSGYSLGGTIGQPDAGVLAGGEYTLGGGFWGGGVMAAQGYEVYVPILLRGVP
jgi:hypothetical protein